MPKPKQIDFNKINAKLNAMTKKLPKLLGNDMLNHSKEAFRNEGFTDASLSPWKARKSLNKADRATGRRRAILVDSGNLRRSGRVRKATFREIAAGYYGIAYASRHNRGLNGMPKRQFVGWGRQLNNKVRKRTRKEFKKALEK